MSNLNTITSETFKNKSLKRLMQIKIWLFLLGLALIPCETNATTYNNVDLDFLILSVRWAPSTCISYRAKNPSNYCTLPTNPNVWVLHGLWPQKGHVPGPFFCNRSLVFDSSLLAPIRSNLEFYWPNLYGGQHSDSLWRHEWDKHGTCAVGLQPLRDEIHFFNSTLSLHLQHNINSYFSLLHIYPSNDGIMLTDLFNNLKNALRKTPRIKCTKANGLDYISEIRMCFNTDLELMDCPENGSGGCPSSSPILYPNYADAQSQYTQLSKIKEERLSCYSKILNLLKIIQFLRWIS